MLDNYGNFHYTITMIVQQESKMQEDKRNTLTLPLVSNDIQPLNANASKTKPNVVERKTSGKKVFSLTKGKWVKV